MLFVEKYNCIYYIRKDCEKIKKIREITDEKSFNK